MKNFEIEGVRKIDIKNLKMKRWHHNYITVINFY